MSESTQNNQQGVMPDDGHEAKMSENRRRAPAGYMEGAKGIGSPECPGYVPTRHELMLIAAYWLTERRFVEMLCCRSEPVDHAYAAVHRLARERLDRLADFLDKEAREWLVWKVEKDFS